MLTALVILAASLSCVLLGLIAFWIYRNNANVRITRASSVEMASDLDAIVSKTVAFRYQGKTHHIPPLSMIEFVEVAGCLSVLDRLKTKNSVEIGELLDAYAAVFSSVCPTITRSDVENMKGPQIGALLNLTMEVLMGKATIESQKKSPNGLSAQEEREGNQSINQS